MSTKGNKCGVCGVAGYKAYFTVPKDSDNTPKRQWQDVIQKEVLPTTRVCWRHFARSELYLTQKGSVKFKEGKFRVYFYDKTKCKISVEIG